MMPRKKPGTIVGQFVHHRIEMLESPAWAELTLASRRVLDRLEIEHAHHGGKENGNLICTYDQFARFGIRRPSISAAISQLTALGFIEVTHKGRGGNADFRDPSRYRLTYLQTRRAAPTEDWQRFVAPVEKEVPIIRDIDSGYENVTGPVGTKAYPKTAAASNGNVPETSNETVPGNLFFAKRGDPIPSLTVMAGAELCPIWPETSRVLSRGAA